MPDDADARGIGEGRSSHLDEHSPDLVGEELADDARIWRVYDKVAREEDRERIGTWNRGLDNLALFAGLFSAVTTAFIIELRQDTQPDYARLTFLVLNATAAGAPFEQPPFAIDPSVQLTNCLWIASLMLSLTAALIAIMGKDWIGMYASRPICNPRQWAAIRTYRLACVERWYMSGVIASAPVLLHFSLVLFAAGLVFFLAPDRSSQRVALAFSLAAGGLYLGTVLSATILPSSPFKSPATQAFRKTVLAVISSLPTVPHWNQAMLGLRSLLSRQPSGIVHLDRRDDAGMLTEPLASSGSSGFLAPRAWRARSTLRFFVRSATELACSLVCHYRATAVQFAAPRTFERASAHSNGSR